MLHCGQFCLREALTSAWQYRGTSVSVLRGNCLLVFVAISRWMHLVQYLDIILTMRQHDAFLIEDFNPVSLLGGHGEHIVIPDLDINGLLISVEADNVT